MRCARLILFALVPAIALAADPAWMARADALLAQPGQAKAAAAYLVALPLADRETSDYHWELARVAQAQDDTAQGAEAAAVVTLLLPGPARDLAPVRAWLSTRAAAACARALAQATSAPEPAARAYLAAVKADGAILAGEDRGLRERSLSLARADAAVTPPNAHACWELGWQAYFQGDLAAARAAFTRAKPLDPDPYRQWLCDLWISRIDREVAAARADDQASDARLARERAEEDARRAKEDQAAAVRQKKEQDAADKASKEEAKAHLRQLDEQIRQLDNAIYTLREREKFGITTSGLPPDLAVQHFEELKAQESAARAQKEKLEAEKASLQSP